MYPSLEGFGPRDKNMPGDKGIEWSNARLLIPEPLTIYLTLLREAYHDVDHPMIHDDKRLFIYPHSSGNMVPGSLRLKFNR